MREMKDSGVEWIGKIPKDWEIVPLTKQLDSIVDYRGKTPEKTEEGTFLVTAKNIKDGKICYELSKEYVREADYEEIMHRGIPQIGDILFTTEAPLGQVANVDRTDIALAQRIIKFRALSTVNNYYLKYWMLNEGFQQFLHSLSTGSTATGIKSSKLFLLPLVRPNIEQQNKIVEYLDAKCSKIDEIVEKQKVIIEKLEEYKLSIITEAVTSGINPDVEMKDSGSVWFGNIPINWEMKRLKYVFHIQKDIAGEEGHTVLSITQRGIIPKDFSNNEGQFANSYANYQLVHKGDFAMNHMDLLTGWVDISKYEGVTSPDYRVFVLNDKNGMCPKYYLYMMQMCYSARIFYGLGQGVSGMGRWRLQADNHLHERRYNKQLTYSNYYVMNKLRVMFARISVSMLEPDLVIMDEFQRFKFLLSSDDSELGILAHSFLSGHDTRVLLLSATPYKLYSTLEEIDENQLDEHYAEFFQVMNFLFDDEVKDIKFKEVWKNYSHALSELKAGDSAIIRMKELAENAMYQGVSRTERISVMDSGDYTDDSSVKHHLQIDENDINSYIQMSRLLSKTDSNHSLPVDYAKSCPYLMSFMKKYKIKEQIEKYYIKHPDEFGSEREQCLLWLNRNKINKYDELPKTNARLEALKEKAFTGGAEKYLWIPPSLPYYEMQGAYKNSKGFSKILVFSAWEMVPRMIGALVSYEAERLTVGKLVHQIKNQDKKNTGYFADGSRRYPVARLRFNVSNGEVRGMSLFALLYPSKTLSDMYLPIESLNNHESLEVIEKSVRLKLKEKLAIIEEKYGDSGNNKEDARWYYLAPMLMDGVIYAKHWIEDIVWEMNTDEEDTTSEVRSSSKDKRNKGFIAHIDKLRSYLDAPEEIHLGRKPEDLLETLVNMVLGSPAICIYRSNGRSTARATSLAKVFVNNFNLPESTAIIDLAYGRCRDDNSHWQNVLKYCKDGCFQAMIDEYIHMLKETAGFQSDGNQYQIVHDMMMDSLKIHTATYIADTYPDFKKRINGADRKSDGCRIRSSYAVGFTKDAGDNSKVVMRKENIRNAFNSPMRPFVLATTSIGQEGLDFHNYCRVIMHWNLPSNPIDVGRILRTFKIKKNVEVTDNGKIII